jgi:serine/threonine protein phosphatase 1
MNEVDQPARIYAIGDIHGRLDLLERVIAAIRRDAQGREDAAITVTVGDYVDRGPQSREVIERLQASPFGMPYVALRGNHESLFESFLSDPATGDHWRRLGGLETLASFGVPVRDMMVGRGYDEAAKSLAVALTAEHRDFLASLRSSFVSGRYFFCHAGVRPGISLERQSEHDLLWIREEFLNSPADFGKVVVHGHTPVAEPDVRRNRINIDTGAFATGRLTCVVLEGESHRFLVS